MAAQHAGLEAERADAAYAWALEADRAAGPPCGRTSISFDLPVEAEATPASFPLGWWDGTRPRQVTEAREPAHAGSRARR